jgi:hypothetical protein
VLATALVPWGGTVRIRGAYSCRKYPARQSRNQSEIAARSTSSGQAPERKERKKEIGEIFNTQRLGPPQPNRIGLTNGLISNAKAQRPGATEPQPNRKPRVF